MRHHRDAVASPHLMHALYGVVAKGQNELRHAETEVTADLKPVIVCGEQRPAYIHDIRTPHVVAKDVRHHVRLD